jgi:anaerobic selenocysteine-containing dehydrogenase
MLRKSFCRICTSMCGLEVDVEGETVRKVRGDVGDPLTQGYCCSKGRAAGETHHRADRLLQPKMRKDGVLQPVGWDEALDDLAARLRRIIDEHGPDAVGVFLGGGCYLDSAAYATVRPMRTALGTRSFYSDMSIDVMSKGVVSEMVGGIACMPRPDYGRTKLVIYVGTNPVVSHGHTSMLNSPTARLREFTASGEVWVLDPRHTETAMKATRHLATNPGGDYAVLGHAVRELLQDGADWDYLNAHAQQVDELRAAVEPFTRERASAISGVPPQDLADFLAAVRRAGRLSIESGTGVSMSPSGNMTAWMSWALMIVTGSFDREAGAWSNPGFFLRLDELDIPSAPPNGNRQPGPPSRPELLTVAGEYVCAAMPDEIESGNLKALINLSGHLLACLPDVERMTAAFRSLEVLATIEILDNTMTEISTHALPAKDQLERVDVSLAVDPSFPEIGAQFTPAMVAPRGEARSYWWILAQLGKRMGLDFLPGVDPDTATDVEVVGRIAAGGRAPIDVTGEGAYVLAQDRAIGWLRARADGLGGFRLAPPLLVEQLKAMNLPQGLKLISRRQLYQHNSRKVPSVRDVAAIYVNPDDAAERGLADGDIALLRSAHGQIEGAVKYDRTLVRGALSVPHGWQGQYNVNRLTSMRDVDPITGMPCMSNLPVELTKVAQARSEPRMAEA